MSKTLLTLAALGVVAAAPALATPRDPKPAEAPATTAADTAASPTAKPTRYCVMVDAPTGSRISKRVCQTRDAWLAEGFDPLARQQRR